jgi:type VI secretion system protein ImpH
MATAGGQSGPSLIGAVVGQYARFDVHQLVRLLRHRSEGPWPVDARLRFRADLGAAFPGHEVTRLSKAPPMPAFRLAVRERGEMPVRVELRTPNYCVASELGPLPEPFLEWVREQERVGGHAMPAFLDVFNQRLHVLRHDLKSSAVRALDPAPPASTRYATQLASLMGLGLKAQQAQVPLPMRAWLGLAGLMINTRKSGAVVAQILSAYLGVQCRLRMLVGRWRPLERRDRLCLGRCGHRLGDGTLLGRTTWDARAAVALEVGFVSFERLCALLPLRAQRPGERWPAEGHRGLVSMIRLLLDRRFDCDVDIAVDAETVPPSVLRGMPAAGAVGLRLGQSAWLGRPAAPRVRFTVPAFDDMAFDGMALDGMAFDRRAGEGA